MTTALPSFQELVEAGTLEMQEVNPELTVADGDVTEAIIHGGAVMAEMALGAMAQMVRDMYFTTAQGTALDNAVTDKLGAQLARQAGSSATCVLTFSRAGAGAGAGTIPAGTQVASAIDAAGNQVTFTTDDAVIVGSSGFSSDVDATCTVEGVEGRASPGTLTRIVSAIFDPSIVVTNAQAAGGNPPETDDDYARRAASAWETQRRATLAALEQGALEVPSVRTAYAWEDTTGQVYLFVADAGGNSNAQMEYDVRVKMEEWRAGGVNVVVVGGTSVQVDVAIVIRSHIPEFDVEQASSAIITSVEALIDAAKPNETIYFDQLTGAVLVPFYGDVKDVDISVKINGTDVPVGQDLIPQLGQTLRSGTVTVTEGMA